MGCNVSSGGCNAVDAAMLLHAGSVRTAAEQAQQRKELDLLWKLTAGVAYETQTDTDAAYQKTVPSGTVAAEIGSIGGKTVERDETPVSAKVTEVRSVGKNLFDKEHIVKVVGKYRNDQGLEVTSGSDTSYTKMFVPVSGSTTYSQSGALKASSDYQVGVYFFDAEKNWISKSTSASKSSRTFTTPENCRYIDLQFRNDTWQPDEIQIELGSAATDYAPYHADTLEIPAAVRALEGYGESEIGGDGNTLNLADGTYTEIGRYVDGVWTLLDTPVVTDVSGLLAGTVLDTEAGGTLTFVQEGGTELAVPSSVEYLIKLSEVTE